MSVFTAACNFSQLPLAAWLQFRARCPSSADVVRSCAFVCSLVSLPLYTRFPFSFTASEPAGGEARGSSGGGAGQQHQQGKVDRPLPL